MILTPSKAATMNLPSIPPSPPRQMGNTANVKSFVMEQVKNFNLVCDRMMLRPLAMTTYFIGYATSTVFLSIVGDIIGRRLECCVCLTCLFVTNIIMPFSTSVYMFGVLRFLDGFFASTSYRTIFIMGLEFMTPKFRLVSGTVMLIVYCTGAYVLVFIAYFIRDWRWLQLTVAMPMAIPIIYWWPRIFPESPRWLISRGRYEEATKILQHAAKMNKKTFDDDVTLLKINEKSKTDEGIMHILKDLFKSKELVIRLLIIAANWFTVAFIYYGLTINIGKFGGNLYSNYAVSITAELLGYLTGFLLDKTGRKPMHLGVFFGSSVACFLSLVPILVLDESYNWLLIVFAMIGKFGVSAGFGEIYLYTGELFPTVVRSLIMGLSGAGSRIGAILSPYMFYLADGIFGKVLPFLIYGILTFCVAILSLKLPETKLTKLPQQVQDAHIEENTKDSSIKKDGEDAEELDGFVENEF
ncbi:organic cation transporter protein-like isoform X2 [Ostrea edulis]|uniref:organic cation transporter protein-like isoform X2 n=1 Tax=Ostrea edulis TaxID=37623 RepID=UPI0024AF5373|nr:organic cation transporter protein-like isoform X2 [Ostrea edulis]